MHNDEWNIEILKKELKNALKPLSPHKLELYYSKAHSCYEVGKYDEACEVFELLVAYDPFEKSFWKGLASTRQMKKDYELALKAWSMLALLAPKCPYSHYHAAECYIAMKNYDEASLAIEQCREKMKNEEHPLKDKVALLEERWKPEKQLSLQQS